MNPPFTTAEKVLLLIRLIFLTPWTLLIYILYAVSISLHRGLPLWPFIRCACLKVVLRTFTGRQIQYLSPTTRKTYTTWVRQKLSKSHSDASVQARLKVEIDPLTDERSSILWVGDCRKAKKVVLFLHGGGYVVPLLPGHLEWCWRTYVSVGMENGVETAVAVLEYTLCPEALYPVQLRQAVAALARLLDYGIRPRDIIVGGDSAGGNLAAQLISHLCEAVPLIPTIVLDEPLAGMFLVSPRLSNKTTDESFVQNAWIDMISAETVAKSNMYYLGLSAVTDCPAKSQMAAFPIDRDLAYMCRMPLVVKAVYLTVGNEEVLRDQVIRYASEVRCANPSFELRLDLQERMAHDFILLEGQNRTTGRCMLAMRQWYKGLLTEKGSVG
ncbi:Esterase [Metarhizium anisopliae]|nr:Esterase [Metarhizium anisopliae]